MGVTPITLVRIVCAYWEGNKSACEVLKVRRCSHLYFFFLIKLLICNFPVFSYPSEVSAEHFLHTKSSQAFIMAWLSGKWSVFFKKKKKNKGKNMEQSKENTIDLRVTICNNLSESVFCVYRLYNLFNLFLLTE